MINKIGKITVYVEDQEQAKDFWLNKMGFVLKLEQPMGQNAAWIEVGPSNDEFTTLVLYSKEAMKQQNPSAVAHPSILFSTSDIEAAYEQMKQNGVEVEDMLKMPFGTMFTFKDQDGNNYLLREDK
ncbi:MULTISPECIES: VOC family protein [Cytobacillus]|uniref:VOC family protein n=1 Tax=Cytobacillus pseudoceanisediminis TaxID=3051614 RepID=A0ABZ2ZL98_9BACI|nr:MULTISPECIES: VOC family protein [Cytobacillus]EFV75213.1 glyoxalase [Bacillus sp. 2_A_57_CT2]MCS0825283.1 VOC family protein [Cytobacillus firmus]MCM3245078.1 VOC family protein [Cytobacillus oceanisediminis]MCM3403492.1 VOC family protein [Cytobacillus oceanisediminis]MDK7667285.1 VOC family protein [Cytobacillus oceanisediminis]